MSCAECSVARCARVAASTATFGLKYSIHSAHMLGLYVGGKLTKRSHVPQIASGALVSVSALFAEPGVDNDVGAVQQHGGEHDS